MPPFHEICAKLADEPFRLRPWEVERLTDFQIEHIFFAPRDSEGRLVLTNPSRQISFEEAFKQGFRKRGLSEAQINDLWETRQRKHGQKPVHQP